MKWLNGVVCKFIYPSKLCFNNDQKGGLAAFPTKGSDTFQDIINIDALSSETFHISSHCSVYKRSVLSGRLSPRC